MRILEWKDVIELSLNIYRRNVDSGVILKLRLVSEISTDSEGQLDIYFIFCLYIFFAA